MKRICIIVVLVAMGFIPAGLSPAFDFNGDGADDIAVFRPSTGLWAVRGVTRSYFGTWNDEPAVGDYDGDGIDEIAIYRARTGLWAIQGGPRTYFGSAGDLPIGSSDGDWYRSGNNLCALAGGNIGISTGTPAYKLDVVGNRVRLSWSMWTSSEQISLRTDGAAGIVEVEAANADLFLKSNSGDTCIQPFGNGNVGIGTMTPSWPLEVDGAIMLDVQASDPPAASWAAGIFAKSVSAVTELFSIDSAGNTNQISPHDPETGKWIFYSKNIYTGRVLRIEMEELIFDLAKEMSAKTGKQYIFEHTE